MRIILNILLAITLLLTACNPVEKKKDKPIKIVCTTNILGDLVEVLAADQSTVVSLMGAGVDPHLYKATQGDLMELNSADVIIYNGLHLEGKMTEIFEKLSNRKNIIAATAGVDQSKLINNSDFKGAYDPHLWFDVKLWIEVIDYIAYQLSTIDGLNQELINQNKEAYIKQLQLLNEEVKSKISSIDKSQRVLITAHDAFAYFGRAYDIEVRGLQGISTLSEYGLKDVSELVDFIVERKIKAVFVESSVSDRSLKAVVQGCRSKGHDVVIGGTLYSDALGAKDSNGGTYIEMVRHNVNTIVENLR